jgi:hypothetical protein
MSALAVIVGITSGFALIGHHEAPATLLGTSLAVDASLSPLTAVIAARRGRSPLRWAVVGFAFGAWSLAYVLVFRPRQLDYPSPSSAA